MQPGFLRVESIAELSSFESGSATWRIQAEGRYTRVIHESRLKPKLFILPVIGELLMKKYLREDTLVIFKRIECNTISMLEQNMESDLRYLSARLSAEEDCGPAPG